MAGDSQVAGANRLDNLTQSYDERQALSRRPGRHVSGEQFIIKLSKQQVPRKEKKKDKRGSALHIYLKESATK